MIASGGKTGTMRFMNFMRRPIILLLFFILETLAVLDCRATTNVFRAGAAAVDITPWMGISINGNMLDQKGTNIHDALHARCIALDDGTNRLAIVVTDSCMIYREIFDEAKRLVHARTGLPLENMLMSATHAHSAPASVSIFQSDANKEYQHFLTLRLADAVQQALVNLQPAQIGWSSGRDTNDVFCRRWKMQPGVINRNPFGQLDVVRMNPAPGSQERLEPAGTPDPEISILALRTAQGRPIAILANYSLHYVGGVGDGTVSADYYGAVCDRMAQLLDAEHEDPPFVGIMSNGTSGDCNNINFWTAQKPRPNFEQIHQVANRVADVAREAYKEIRWHDWVPLRSAQKELTLSVRLPSSSEIEEAKAKLASAAKVNGQFKNRDDIYRRETLLMADFPHEVPLILQAFLIGTLAIDAIPCEVFSETGLAIKQASPFEHTFTIELANGYNGYLPTPEQHRLGGYETWRARSTYLAVDAEPKIREGVLELLQGLEK